MSAPKGGTLGVVVIGRNEGERLVRCLDSLAGATARIVYVDSGSSDGSVAAARTRGANVFELDTARPFTMARGRNAGFARLAELAPDVDRVQFVDGDCELAPGWLDAATRCLDAHPEVGAVSGRRRERERERSLYNRMTDMEWDAPAGESDFVAGDVMMRAEVFRAIGGYRESLIAGEDPEISVRIRAAGWKIRRLADDMTRHDAGLHRFGQWWTRSLRSGHAYAENAHTHRATPGRPWARECRSNWLWGLALPAAALLGALVVHPVALALLLLWPLQAARIALARRRHFGDSWNDCALWGALVVLGKLPQALGQAKFHWHRLRGRPAGLLEYKD